MAAELASASTIEGARFTAQVLAPNLAQGLFRRRRRAVAVATRLNVDGQAVGLIRGLRRSHGDDPIWVRAGTDRALLVTSVDDIQRVLEGSPDPFAPDPDAKRKGMAHFQPTALTISRDGEWEKRRRFTEAVLDTGRPTHRLAERFAAVTAEEAAALLAEVDGDADRYLEWESFNAAVRRVALRAVLGDAARDDDRVFGLLSKLMDEANGLPDSRSESYEPYRKRIEAYVADAEPESIVGLFGDAPADADSDPAGQVTHWLFALGDTLAINAWRALALISTHPAQAAEVMSELGAAERRDGALTAFGITDLDYLEACLEDAMRLYPTTPLLSRETVREVDWSGSAVPKGVQVLISNVFNHRDPDRLDFADRFAPDEWLEGGAAESWQFNHFSHGPQGCPGTWIALFVGRGLCGALLGERRLDLVRGPDLDPERDLPKMLDYFGLRFALEPLA
jgi:cytochrome P450